MPPPLPAHAGSSWQSDRFILLGTTLASTHENRSAPFLMAQGRSLLAVRNCDVLFPTQP